MITSRYTPNKRYAVFLFFFFFLFSHFYKTDGMRLMPKGIKYNVVQPGGAATKVAMKKTASLVDNFAADVQDTYDKYKGECVALVSS